MGISKLKKLLSEALSRAFMTPQIQLFGREIERNLDLYDLTGFPKGCSIPRKDAAEQLVDYFFKTKRISTLLEAIIKAQKFGFKGENVFIPNLNDIIKEMEECGYRYKNDLEKVVLSEKKAKRADWGFLEEGHTYNFCFISIDICGNSELVRKYNSSYIKETYTNFKKLVNDCIISRNGRIWSWEGDGGLVAFLLDDFVNNALFASIDILNSLIKFNTTINFLNEPLSIRIGINAGNAEYKKNTQLITSDSIELTRRIEKHHTETGTISISKHTYQYVNVLIREFMIEKEINGASIYQLKLPIWNRKELNF